MKAHIEWGSHGRVRVYDGHAWKYVWVSPVKVVDDETHGTVLTVDGILDAPPLSVMKALRKEWLRAGFGKCGWSQVRTDHEGKPYLETLILDVKSWKVLERRAGTNAEFEEFLEKMRD